MARLTPGRRRIGTGPRRSWSRRVLLGPRTPPYRKVLSVHVAARVGRDGTRCRDRDRPGVGHVSAAPARGDPHQCASDAVSSPETIDPGHISYNSSTALGR